MGNLANWACRCDRFAVLIRVLVLISLVSKDGQAPTADLMSLWEKPGSVLIDFMLRLLLRI